MSDVFPMSWEESVAWLRADPARRELVEACFFDDPILEAAQRFRASGEWQATRALLPSPPGYALDVGAGRGIASYALAADGWRVSALEPDPSALVGAAAIHELVQQSGHEVEIVTEFGEKLPFDDATFDVVVCRQVLHHARDLEGLCRQVARTLKPGGVMIATREHVLSRREDLQAFLDSHPLHHLYGGENAFLLADYVNAIRQAGLQMTHCLNPLQSDINLYPMTVEDHRTLIAQRFHVPAALIANRFMRWIGDRMDAPGRLYTFVARKRGADS